MGAESRFEALAHPHGESRVLSSWFRAAAALGEAWNFLTLQPRSAPGFGICSRGELSASTLQAGLALPHSDRVSSAPSLMYVQEPTDQD